jgi:hypothetical protein
LLPPQITQQPQSQTVGLEAMATFSVSATSAGSITYQWEAEAPGGSSFTAISGATSSTYAVSAATPAQSGTQFICILTNSASSIASNSATLTVLNASNYVTAASPGSPRNNFSGWVGMSFTVGNSPIAVYGLGRFSAPGDAGSHTVKIVTASNSQDVSGASTTVSMSGGTAGSFVYASLSAGVTLNANTAYYILSQETASGDQWYDMNTTVSTATVASETGAVWSPDGATYNPLGSSGQAYVPVDLLYSLSLPRPVITNQPQSQTVSAGATATFSVTATGAGSYQWESEGPGGSSFTAITGATSSSYTTPATTLAQSGTQYMCVVTNTVGSTPSNAATLSVTSAPASTNYVASTSLGTLRNNFSGWVGISFTVGSSPVTVSGLGRMFAPGDTGSHAAEIVTASNGQEVPGGSVVISMAGGTAGSFVYANLPSTVTLNANATYYILSQETSGGDQWYDMNTTITTTAVASEIGAVWSPDGATYNPIGSAGQAYVPVDFLYTTTTTQSQPAFTKQPQSQTVSVGATATFSVTATGGGLSYQWESEAPGGSSFANITGATSSSYTSPATTLAESGTQYMCVVTNTVGSTPSNAATLTVTTAPATTNYVTSTSLGGLRNNFSGWVGMSFTVGTSPVTLSGLGRFFAPSDTGSHTVKIVTASNSQNVTGGSVSISMSGGTAGSFVYANLPSTVTLNANTTYYILSQETSGGDQWYDINTTVATTAVASEIGAVWSPDGVTYNPIGSAGQAYVPVDFLYTTTLSQPGITTQPQSQTVSAEATATFSVTATGGGLSYQWQSEAPGGSSFTNITGATSSSYTTPATTLAQSGTQYMCVVTNTVGSTPSNAATLTVTTAPATTNYVTSTSLGGLRNNFSGWVGMSFTVGSSPVTVSGLGRFFAPGDAGSHTVKIVTASNSQNVTGGSVSISMSGGTVSSFVYANLPSTVTLNANTTYYILSQETSGGDQWYDINTTVATTAVASEIGAVWSPDGTTYNPIGTAGQAYVPVDFVYTTTTTLSQPAFTKQPQSQTVSAGATATFSVTATGGGLSYQWESEAPGGSSFTNITGATSSSYTTPTTTLAQSGTQYMCVVTNTIGSTPSNAATLTVTSAPASTNYVTSTSLGNLRNNFGGWVGMSFTVGSSPITVSGLGRMFAPGDTGSHTVKIVTASNSQDLSGGSVTISMSGGTAGSFVYASLPSTVTLNANTTYYILSQEAVSGDQWYDMNTTITTATIATEMGAVWSPDGATYNPIGSAGEIYGPVDFLYTTTPSQPGITTQPQSQTVGAGSTATFSVTATGGGLSYQWQSEAPGGSSFSAITGATSSTYMTPTTTLAESGTQFECVVSNTQGSVPSNPATLTVTQAAQATITYVTSETFGTVRNNYDGYIGMQIVVGPSPLSIVSLGRIVVPGNTGTHQIKIVNASAGSNEDAGSPYYVYHPGVDVSGGSVTVNTVGGTPGSFVYSNLASPITLNANTPYYILSLETNGGDSWYDHQGTNVTTTTDAVLTNAVYGTASPYAIKNSSSDTMYGPVNFQYTVLPPVPGINQQPTNATVAVGQSTTFSVIATGSNLTYQWESEAPGGSSFTAITGATSSSYTTPAATLAQNGTQYMCVVTNTFGSTPSSAATLAVVTTLPTTNYVTSTTLGTLRNDFSGWVGMSFTVGNSPLSVSGLGRIFAAGNTDSHMVEIVNASNSQVVTGGSVSISMSGGTPGSFVYANLPATVTLAAYTSYYILTQETAGGDQWYDNNTSIQTTSVAGETSGVYSPDGATFSPDGNAGQSYGPVDFLYVIP